MTVSPNTIIGSLVWRTREALNRNAAFLDALAGYYYAPNCLVDGKFGFWHFPGTQAEISAVLLKLGEAVNGSMLKFPAVLNFQSIRQQRKGDAVTLNYNLAIAGSVKSTWTTREREAELFERVLRPVYDEFMRQAALSGYFLTDYGLPPHDYYEVFTTGQCGADQRPLRRACRCDRTAQPFARAQTTVSAPTGADRDGERPGDGEYCGSPVRLNLFTKSIFYLFLKTKLLC